MYGIALVDDHGLFRESLKIFFDSRWKHQFQVVLEASNEEELKAQLFYHKGRETLPELILMNIHMPLLDGRHATSYIKSRYPHIKIIGMSTFIDRYIVMDMLKRGADGLITKKRNTGQLIDAISAVRENNIYVEDYPQIPEFPSCLEELSERQKTFLNLCVSELSYKQIADKMYVSPKTIENYRDSLFRKYNIKSRTGLVLHAIKMGLASY